MNNFPKFYNKIFDYSLKKGTHIKFNDILKTRTIIGNKNKIAITTKHIYNELPIRLANRVTDLNNLPFGLAKNHSINKVREWYLTSCLELFETKEPMTKSDIINFKSTIENIYKRHSPTLLTISKGLYELKRDKIITDIEEPTMQQFLNRFYTNRTEIRILLEYYISLFDNKNEEHNFGTVNLKCFPHLILNDVINNIQYICNKHYSNIELDDIIKVNVDKNLYFPTIDNYLYYVLFELLKNSVKAVIEKKKYNMVNNYLPHIDISITDHKNYILVRIEDNGIGIKDENKDKIWYFSYSSSRIDEKDILEDNDFSVLTPLSGFGYGLPITNIYADFFNSTKHNIVLISEYGQGTTVCLYMKKYI